MAEFSVASLRQLEHLRSVAEDLISDFQKRTKRIYQKRRRNGHYKTLKPIFSTGHNYV